MDTFWSTQLFIGLVVYVRREVIQAKKRADITQKLQYPRVFLLPEHTMFLYLLSPGRGRN
jgi:hypothetical protein